MFTIFKFCKNYLNKHKVFIIIYFLICILSSVFSLIIPYISGNFIDLLISNINFTLLYNYCIFFSLISLGIIILGYVSNRIYTILQAKMTYEMNENIIKHIQKLSISFIFNKNVSYLTQHINSDSSSLITFCIGTLSSFFMNIMTFIVSLIILLNANILIAFVLSSFLILYFFAFKLCKKSLYQKGFDLKEKQSYFFSKLYEQLQYIKFIKSHGIQLLFNKRLYNSFKVMLSSTLKYQNINYSFLGLDSLISTISQIALFLLGGIEVIKGNLTVGQFSFISIYFNIMMSSIKYFFNLGKIVQDNMISYNRLIDILNNKKESEGNKKINNIESIYLHNINFYYGDKCILKNLTTIFTKGKIYALIGSNGSGKSTLINLLLGLYRDEYQGKILYNNIDIKDINMEYVNKKFISVAEQEPILINDTIKYNLILDDTISTVEESKVNNLIYELELDPSIDKFPNGLETIINEKATNFSGGEKSKISFLRLFIKDTDVMILDEPTSVLDVKSQSNLISYLQTIKKNKIIIIVTHDKNIINISDEYLDLDFVS